MADEWEYKSDCDCESCSKIRTVLIQSGHRELAEKDMHYSSTCDHPECVRVREALASIEGCAPVDSWSYSRTCSCARCESVRGAGRSIGMSAMKVGGLVAGPLGMIIAPKVAAIAIVMAMLASKK